MFTFFHSLFAPPRHLLLLLAALWLGIALSEKRVGLHGISKDALNNLVYYSILGYIVGGRLIFALINLSTFTQSPLSIFSVNLDLFDPLGALVTALLVGFIYAQRLNLPFWRTVDALTPMLAMVAVGLSLTHLAAGTAFGKPTNLAWGIDLWNARRHPSQIYELITALIIFELTWFRKSASRAGSDFLLFVSLTAGAHLFLEAFRGDSSLEFGGIRLAQIIAWIGLAAALFASDSIRSKDEVN